MATTMDRAKTATVERAPEQRRPRKDRGLWALAVAGLAAVAVAAVVFFWPGAGEPAPAPRAATSLYTESEQKVMQLVNEGQVPAATLEGGIYRIKSLVNRGLIPAETLNEYREPVRPLYTKQELKIIALVAQGVLPKEVLDGEPFRTKRLINEGLLPREAADAAPSGGR